MTESELRIWSVPYKKKIKKIDNMEYSAKDVWTIFMTLYSALLLFWSFTYPVLSYHHSSKYISTVFPKRKKLKQVWNNKRVCK